jgi:predicted dinucleotide-binding enzyme
MHEFQGTSSAEETAKKTSTSVVKCWNHVFAQIVNSSPDFNGQPATVFYCSDDQGAKEKTAALARDIGYEPADAAPLSSARFIEPLAGLVVTLGYGVGMGTDIAIKLIRR